MKQRSKMVAQLLTGIATFLAFMAFVIVLMELPNKPAQQWTAEMWRTVGLFTFSSLFLLITIRPELDRALWIILIMNKLILSIVGYLSSTEIPGIAEIRIWDPIITFLLIAAFIMKIQSEKALKTTK